MKGGFNIEEALTAAVPKGVRTAVDIPVELVMPNRFQPRVLLRNIDELAESIRRETQLQPISVRVIEDGSAEPSSFKYEVICGGRRLAACQKLGRGTVSAFVYGPAEVSEEQMELWANIENTQREELKFLEAMKSYSRLFEKYGSVKAVSEKTGKTAVTVQYYLNVAKAFDCHDEFKKLLKEMLLSAKKADAFTYTVGGKFAQVAHHIASLDPGVTLKGEVLKKNKREFRRIMDRFERDGIVESMKWVEDKIRRALNAGQPKDAAGMATGPETGSLAVSAGVQDGVFSETDKQLKLSVVVSKLSVLSAADASAIRKGVDDFLSRMGALVSEV